MVTQAAQCFQFLRPRSDNLSKEQRQSYKKDYIHENQDGDISRHTAPPGTIRNDRKSNGKEVRHQVDKKEHTSRLVGGAETGTGVERTCVALAGPRLAECGMNRAGSLTTNRPCDPAFAHT